MRGKPQEGTINLLKARVLMMEKYHQPYSEIRKIPVSVVLYANLLEDEKIKYEIQERRKYEAKMRAMRKR